MITAKTLEKKHISKIHVINIALVILSFLTVLKSIFTEWSYDCSYHLAMSWRHITGDRLFEEMWEPHQTSSFVVDFLTLIYRIFKPNMSFVALYLQITGAVIFSLAILYFYLVLKKCIDKRLALYVSLILLTARPKGTTLMEFSNLLIICTVLLLSFMIVFNKKNNLPLCLAISFFSFMVALAYPSCVLLYIPISIYFFKRNKKYGIAYLLTSFICGLLYLSHLLILNGPSELLSNCLSIVSSDSSHTGFSFAHLFNIDWDYPYAFNLIFPVLMIFGLFGVKKLNYEEKFIWKSGVTISLVTFTGALLLSNLSILSILGYLVLGGAVSLIPIKAILSKRKQIVFILLICFSIIITRGLWIMNGYSTLNSGFILNCENVIRNGPTAGIVAPLQTVNWTRESKADWSNAVNSDDTVLAVGDWIIDSSVYLYSNADISNYSTIDTTTYSEKLNDYWTKYPEKKPTVIAFESYEGTKTPAADTYIDNLIRDEYELSYQGRQWLFYRRKQ